MSREVLQMALEVLKGCLEHPDAQDSIIAIEHELAQPEQEPVAWMHTQLSDVAITHRPADLDRHPDRWTALYSEPKPCPTCESLARAVMMDQTGRDA